MIKKSLLSFGLFATASGALAQIPMFHEGFDAEQTKLNTDLGWWEDINTQEGDERSLDFQNQFAGAGCLKFVNVADPTCENQQWQRAIKFRNLPLQEGKSYRLSFMLKGSSEYEGGKKTVVRPSIMQGEENADIPMLDSEGNEVNYSFNNIKDEYQSYSTVFYYRSAKQIHDKYTEKYPDRPELKDVFFATINIFNPGTFYLDEVEVVESYINQIQNAGFNIKVDFGYKTNIPQLIAASQHEGRLIMPKDCAKVTVDGVEVEVESVELQDNFLYVFLVEEAPDDAKIVVEFTNPTEEAYQIKYTDNAAPEVEGNVVPNFSDEQSILNPDVAAVSSFDWDEAKLTTSSPLDGSFAIDENTNEISVTFDHPVYTRGTDEVNAPVAKLSGGVEETLVLKEGQDEISNTIVFVRPNSTPLIKGSYTVEINYITTEKQIEAYAEGSPLTLTFEVGKIQLAETIYTDLFTNLLAGANGGQPTDWSIMVGGENWNGGDPKEDNGSACRNLNVTGTDGNEYTAFYLCDRDGYTYMKYGDKEGANIALPADDIEFTVYALSHDETGHMVEYRIEDMEGNELAKTSGACSVIANSQFTSIEASDQIKVRFKNPKEQNVILKVRAPQGGYTAARVLGFKVQTYKETEGDKFDPEVIFASEFTGGNMPAEGTGWICYNDNNPLEPGSGRNGTSGMLERNFHAKMQSAAFFRECGTNAEAAHRIEYGNGNGIEGGIEIAAGTYEVTYYAGTWNDDGGNANGTSKVFMDIIDAETQQVVFHNEHVNIANFKNGGDCSGQADKVTATFASKGGKYIIKAWGTTNTVWGALSIIKPGSQAVKYYAMMNEAVEEAKAELEISADEKYNGDTKNALIAEIEKDKDPSSMHTAKEFNDAIAKLNAIKDNMVARRKNIDAFAGNRDIIAAALEKAAGTKFENLAVYPDAVACYDKFKEVNPSDLDDATLATAVSDMGIMGQLINNMMETCVNLLTKQVVELAAMITTIDPSASEDETVIAAGNVISDDQDLAAKLKKLYAAKFYRKVANGENPFEKVEEVENSEGGTDIIKSEDVIPAGALIQNRDFYCTAIVPDKEQTTVASVTDYPGWTIEVFNGAIRPVFNTGWGEEVNAPRAVKPIADAAVRANWGRNEYDVKQLIEIMPVANYNVELVVAKDGDQETESYAYIGEGETQRKSVYVGTDRADSTPQVFENVVPNVDGNLGSMLLGGYINIDASFGSVDKANLEMVSVVEGFDYAAAAAALEKEIADAIENVELAPEGNAVVTYYDLTGKRVANPTGVTIKVESYKNGYMKVSKQIVK